VIFIAYLFYLILTFQKYAYLIIKEAKSKEEQELIYEHQESLEQGEKVKVTNENTGVEHVFNSKTLCIFFCVCIAWLHLRCVYM